MLLSEAVELALIDKVPAVAEAIASIVTAFGAAMAGYFSYKAHVVVKEAKVSIEKTADLSETAVKIAKQTEENTNHLHDEIVKVVAQKEFAAGQKQAKDEAADEAGVQALLNPLDKKG